MSGLCDNDKLYNAIKVLNLPLNARHVDLTILVAKTRIAPFLTDYWLDPHSSTTGHLLLKKPRFMSFVLFVLQKHFSQEDELPYYFIHETISEDDRPIVPSIQSSSYEGADSGNFLLQLRRALMFRDSFGFNDSQNTTTVVFIIS
mmetsp:Transcript_26470/g.45304  ORF Transcript_26470/g.45304 Transcript_26470/m.45304 type:complete len:145 (-) Transcript_26470:88-522(-)